MRVLRPKRRVSHQHIPVIQLPVPGVCFKILKRFEDKIVSLQYMPNTNLQFFFPSLVWPIRSEAQSLHEKKQVKITSTWSCRLANQNHKQKQQTQTAKGETPPLSGAAPWQWLGRSHRARYFFFPSRLADVALRLGPYMSISSRKDICTRTNKVHKGRQIK